jgi:hypothetical protein
LLLLALLVAGCKKKDPPPAAVEEAPSKFCSTCKARAGSEHVCNAGVWWCDACGRDAGDGHQCQRSVFCQKCRRDGARSVDAEPPGTHECGRTDICETCLKLNSTTFEEHAKFHVCGKTRYCGPCHRDVGPGHSCESGSFFCPSCRTERLADGHICGLSHFCAGCGTEATVEPNLHEHKITKFCADCRREVALPHGH